MDLNQLLIFEKVSNNQSFTKAAQELGIEKSTVSMKVSQLEEHLGVRLLNRTTRSVTLTEAGEGYFEYCRQIVETAKEAEHYAETLSSEPQGMLRISTPMDFGHIVVKTLIDPFLKAHPKVSVDLNLTNQPIDIIRERIDVALRPGLGPMQDSTLIAKQILKTELGLYASPNYITRRGEPESLPAIQEHDFILFTIGEENIITVSRADVTYQLQPKARLNINDVLACKEAALSGLGITMIPALIAEEDVKNKKLIRVLPDYKLPTATLFALYPSRQWMPAKLKVFLEYLESWG